MSVPYRLLSIKLPPSGRVFCVLERKDQSDSIPFVIPLSVGAAALLVSGNKEAIGRRKFVLTFVEDNAWYASNELSTEDELNLLVDLLPADNPLKIKRRQIVSLDISADAIPKEGKKDFPRSV